MGGKRVPIERLIWQITKAVDHGIFPNLTNGCKEVGGVRVRNWTLQPFLIQKRGHGHYYGR